MVICGSIKNINKKNMYSYTKYLLVLEGKREKQLRTKYIDKLGLSEETFNKFYNAKDTEWLLKTYINTDGKIKTQINDKTSLNFDDLLIKYTEIFNKNKENFDITQISKIDGLDELREVIDSNLKDFDNAEYEPDNEIWILENNYEWFIYKPYTYDMSETYGNNKLRETNWCTTYEESYFKQYLGPQGGLLYMVNKLDPKKDISLEITKTNIIVWDYKDHNTETFDDFLSLFNTKSVIPEKAMMVLKENIEKLNNNIPEYDLDDARNSARENIENYHFDDLYYSYGLETLTNHIDSNDFFGDIRSDELNRWYDEWKHEDSDTLKDMYFELVAYSFNKWNNDEIKDYFNHFKDEILEYNKENESEEDDRDYVNFDNLNLTELEDFIDDTGADIVDIIENTSFDEEIIEEITDRYMSDYNDDPLNYITSIYGREPSVGDINWILRYIDMEALSEEIVDNMDDEELRNYL